MINVLTDRAEMAINFVVNVYFSFSQAYELSNMAVYWAGVVCFSSWE